MRWTRLSLFYVAGYLVPLGVLLLSGDPMFLVLLAVVAVGLLLTGGGYVLDRRAESLPAVC
jgi:hypothetical protein